MAHRVLDHANAPGTALQCHLGKELHFQAAVRDLPSLQFAAIALAGRSAREGARLKDGRPSAVRLS